MGGFGHIAEREGAMAVKPTVLVGIDPGATVGIAILFKATKELTVQQFKGMYEAMRYLHHFCQAQAKNGEIVHLVIEDARKARKSRAFADKNGMKRNQGVGDVKGACREYERFAILIGVSFELRAPSNTKMDEVLFEKITGIKTLKTHTHCRDAACLII